MSKGIIPQFIRTSDEATAQKLRDAGYYEIKEQAGTGWCFVNSDTIKFDGDGNKIVYTDKLMM